MAGLKTDAFKLLADSLKAKGISSYRYDKRGIAASTKVPESSMTMQMFVDDASTIVDFFSQDFDEIYILGHSEGALIGTMVSHQNFNVHALVAICGTSVSLDSILLDQLKIYPKLVPLAEQHINEINSGQPLSEVNPLLMSLFRESVVPFLRSAFKLDPASELAKVDKEVLIIGGNCDKQVPPEHATNLFNAKPDSELVIIEQMGHTLKNSGADCAQDRKSYFDSSMPIHQSLLKAIVDFIE